jgi:hypothetical protein
MLQCPSTLPLPLRYGRDTLTADGPVQYFDEPVRSAIIAKVKRTGGEIDGRIDYDVDGTLSGNWFAEDLPVEVSGRGGEEYYGVRKLAFARDVFSPDRQRISIGGLGLTGLWGVPTDSPDFAAVTPASGLMTYRLLSIGAPQAPPIDSQAGWLLVQLLDAGHLRIEASPLPYPVPVAFAAAAAESVHRKSGNVPAVNRGRASAALTRPRSYQPITNHPITYHPISNHPISNVLVYFWFSQTALTKPGLPAESHAAKRTHDFPVASNGMEKRLVPNAGRSVAGMI